MQEDKYEIDFLFSVILCVKNITNEMMPLFFNPHLLVSEPRLIVGKLIREVRDIKNNFYLKGFTFYLKTYLIKSQSCDHICDHILIDWFQYDLNIGVWWVKNKVQCSLFWLVIKHFTKLTKIEHTDYLIVNRFPSIINSFAWIIYCGRESGVG